MRIALKEYNEIMGLTGGAYHEAALRMHMSDSELNILYVICSHEPGCYQKVLYQETGMTKSTVNSAVKKLEQEGILCLKPGEGRNTCVFLTEKGQQLAESTVYKVFQMENEIFDSWSPEEQETFLHLNRDFLERLEQKVREL